MTPEGKVKARVKTLLSEHKAYYFMPVQNGMGAPSLDFLGCCNGRAFAVEAKAGNGKMTARQQHTANAMHKAGCTVFTVNATQGLEELDNWLLGARAAPL